MTDIAEIQSEIEAVKFALRSFADYNKNEEEERINFLRKNFTAVPGLKTYFGYPQDKLRDALDKLRDVLDKLQDEKNLQQHEKNLLLEKEKEQQHEKNLLLEKENLLLAQQQGKIFIF